MMGDCMSDDKKLKGLELLRKPFPEHQISLLPKPYKRDSPKGKCNECGGYHGLPAVHLSYVGHAALTDRLLECDPEWNWEPLALDSDGLPKIDRDGGLWIKLTVCGVTRLGYGDAQGKTGGDAMKERIGDALRNAAMRFGAALDLWHRGDLHLEEEQKDEPPKDPPKRPAHKKVSDYKAELESAQTENDLKQTWLMIPNHLQKQLVEVKDEVKRRLERPAVDNFGDPVDESMRH